MLNRGLRRDNRTGQTGVRWNSQCAKWQAIFVRKHLGLFGTFEEAVAAREAAVEASEHRSFVRR